MARGGARPGSGPKPRHGEAKTDKNVALTPIVLEFLRSNGMTVGESIETKIRRSSQFREWMKQRKT